MTTTSLATEKITITQADRERLERLLDQHRDGDQADYLDSLRSELNRAVMVDPSSIPADVITMNSVVSLVDLETSEEEVFTLVYPSASDVDEGKISVMAPLGTAMLGHRVGDVFEWDVPMGRKRWRVSKILYQPEAAGDNQL